MRRIPQCLITKVNNLICLFLDICSPGSRLKLLYERKKSLVNIDLEDRVKVVSCDHLSCKSYDDYKFLVIEELP